MTIAELQTVHRQHTEYIEPRRSTAATPAANDDLVILYRNVRQATEAMAAPLAREDTVIQTMPDVSPTKWHLGHTSWFFEQFLLVDGPAADEAYEPFHDRFAYIFNSYYVTVGDRHCRIKRGTLSRPTLHEVMDYRRHVDRHVIDQLRRLDATSRAAVEPLLTIGLNHEQQHIELAYTDIKHVFSCNPLYPTYARRSDDSGEPGDLRFLGVEEGVHEIGHEGDGFSYDNERPRHRVYLRPFEIGDRLVTNGEFIEFMKDGGYDRAPLWLSEGWGTVNADRTNWSAPFYWHRVGDEWFEFTLGGLVPLDLAAPACHLSYFEADAYAKWKGCRLPTEAEWEVAVARHATGDGSFLEDGRLHPRRDTGGSGLRQASGEVWQWTASQYTGYPGYQPPAGALGEYNGKFMCNQFVLRGASCVTPRSHARPTYRNFFPPDARWQFTGLRLARDV